MNASLSELTEDELREKCESYEVIFTETERFWLDSLNNLNSIITSVEDTPPERIPDLLTNAAQLIASGYRTIEETREKLELSRDIYDLRDQLDKTIDEYEATKLQFEAQHEEDAKYIASLQAELILLRENERQPVSREDYDRILEENSRLRDDRDRLLNRVQDLEAASNQNGKSPYVDTRNGSGTETKPRAPLHSEESSYNLSDLEYAKLKEDMMEQLRIYNQQQMQAILDKQDQLRWKERSVQRGDVRDLVNDEPTPLPNARRPSVDEQPEDKKNLQKSKRHSHLVRSNTLTEWSDMSLLNLKDQMMGELRNLQKEQLESMFNQQDSLRWNEKTSELKDLKNEIATESANDNRTKISSRSRQSNLVRNRTKTDWAESDLQLLKEEMVEELHRIHVEEMERIISTQDELRLPRPKRNVVKDDDSSNDLSEEQIARLRDEMLSQLEVITRRELGNMFERQQQLRWGSSENEKNPSQSQAPPPEQIDGEEMGGPPPLTPQNTQFLGNQSVKITEEFMDFGEDFDVVPPRNSIGASGRVSNLYRSNTATEWKEEHLETLKNEMANKVHEIQKDRMKKMFEEKEKLYWVPPEEDVPEMSEPMHDPTPQPRMSREGPSQSIVIHEYEYEDEQDEQPIMMEVHGSILDVPQDSVSRDEEARSPREISVSSVMWNPEDTAQENDNFVKRMSKTNPREIVPRGSGSLSAAIRASMDLLGNKIENGNNGMDQLKLQELEQKNSKLELDLKSARAELLAQGEEIEFLKTSKYALVLATSKEIDELRDIIYKQSKAGANVLSGFFQ